MAWYVPVFLRVLLAHGFYPWVSKHVVMKHSLQKRHLLNFSFCAFVAILLAVWQGHPLFTKTALLIFVVGIANGWAAYCQWKAIGISLSRNSLFTFLDDVIAMGLSYFILQESKFLNLQSGAGILLSLTAVALLAVRDYQNKKGGNREESVGARLLVFYFYVGFYSVVWGVATFLMKFWGTEEVPVTTFLAGWYAGAWVGSLSIFLYAKWRYSQINPPFTKRDFGYVVIMGSTILIALALGYMSYERAPQTIVQPIFLVSEMALPAIIGLFGFAERKGFKLADWLLIALGITGGAMVGLSYHG